MDGRGTRAVYAHKAAYRVQPSEFQLRRLHRDAVRRRVLDWAGRLVRRGHPDAEDIFPEVRLPDAMACQAAGRSDAFGQGQLRDENSEVRRDVAAHQMVVHRDALGIFGLAKEEHPQDAAHPSRCLMPTMELQMAQQRQDVVQRERPADRVRQAEAELPGAAQMGQLQVLLDPRARRLREPLQTSQPQVLE